MAGRIVADSLPFNAQPHDAMRQGLASLKEDAMTVHPVHEIQTKHKQVCSEEQLSMMKQLYGTAVPARMQIETQILGKFQRLPGSGLPSSKLGLESLTGELDEFSFESYLGMPGMQDSEDQPASMHHQMEQQLGMGTKPVARGFI